MTVSNRPQRIVFVIALLAASVAMANTSSIAGRAITQKPTIDGEIKPGEWSQAAKLKLVTDKKANAEDKESWQPVAWVGYSYEGLYIAVDCPQDWPPRTGGFEDTFDFFKKSDTVELFLRPGVKTRQYLHLAVNPAEIRYDAMGYDNSHDINWEARTSRNAKGWQVEVFLPFAGMGFTDALESTWKIQIGLSQRLPNGRGRLARWPGGSGSFHQMKNFGTLGPISVNLKRFGDSVSFTEIKPLNIGTNPLPLRVNNRSGQAKAVRVVSYVQTPKGEVSQTVTEALPAGTTCNVSPAIIVDSLKNVEVELELINALKKVLFRSPRRVLKPARQKVEVILTKPAYRNTIYSSYPHKEIKFEIHCAYDQQQLADKQLKVDFARAGGQTPPMRSLTANARQVVELTLDNMGDLPIGDYAVLARLVDKDGKVIAATEELLRKLPPAPGGKEVICDEHHRLLVNGKPFFPLGVFLDNPGSPMAGCDKAWNTIMPSGYGLTSPRSRWFDIYAKQLDVVHNSKRMFVLQMNGLIQKWDDPQARHACKMAVQRLSKHPALLAWGIEEEANLRVSGDYRIWETRLKRIIEDIREWDPYHPVMSVVSPNGGRGWEDFPIYGPMMDITSLDIYPIPRERTGEEIGKVAEGMQRMIKAVKNRRPVWFVPQIAGWRHHREPTYEEMKCMFYSSVVNGARGLIAFGVNYPLWTQRDGHKDMYMTKQGLDRSNRLAREVSAQMDVFNGINHPATSDKKLVDAVVKETPKGLFLVVASVSHRKLNVSLTAETMKGISKAIHKGQTIKVVNGTLQDTFGPLDCRVYQLQK